MEFGAHNITWNDSISAHTVNRRTELLGYSMGMGNPHGSWVWVVHGLGVGILSLTHSQPIPTGG